VHPVEKLRRIWTPQREIEEIFANLDPQTELDSMIRDFLARIIVQHHGGSVRLSLEGQNVGSMRWEIVHHEASPGVVGGAEATIWIE